MRRFSKGVRSIKASQRNALILIVSACLLVAAGVLAYSRWKMQAQEARRQQVFSTQSAAGAALLAQNKPAEAIPPLELAAAAAPHFLTAESLAVFNNLATSYSATGQMEKSRDLLARARSDLLALPAGQLNTPAFIKERVRLATGLANIELAKGRLPEAEVLYRQAMTLYPQDAAGHGNLANVLLLEERYREANDQFELAVARQPDNAETLNNWGMMLLSSGQPEVAEEKFRAALAVNPKSARYFYSLGLALKARDQLRPAIQAQRTAIHFDPKMVPAFQEAADLYAQLQDFKTAETFLRGALEIDRNNISTIVALAKLLAVSTDPGQRDFLESASLYKKAVDLTHGQDVNYLVQLADTYALAEFFEQAYDTLKQAIALAQKQKLAPVDLEVLRQHKQYYFLRQHPTQSGTTSPLTTVGGDLGTGPKVVDPYDIPAPVPTTLPAPVYVTPP